MRRNHLLNVLRKSGGSSEQDDGLGYIAEGIRHLAVPLESINLNPENERFHDSQSINTIMSMLEQFTQRVPIVVQRQGMITRDGNGRVEAARKLGWTHIAALVVDESDAQSIAYALGANRTPELSEWKLDVLQEHLLALQENDIDLTGLGWDEAELGDLLEVDDALAEPEPLEVNPEKQVMSFALSPEDYAFAVDKLDTVRKDMKIGASEAFIHVLRQFGE